ncbi:MAG TPA: fumarylacetoacetate hydrolase family protein, partial [Acidimicrobiales bacterium]|nr:fumarylacetoacetate hydrolase family protein [Acidimicrobiales bacterium]
QASGGRFGPGLRDVYDTWPEFRTAVRALDPLGGTPVEPDCLGPPSPEPRQVFGIGLNYAEHAEESNLELPSMPATFTKFPTCLAGPFADVELPADTVDWEVELVVVIGRPGRRVPEPEAWDHVAGLTVGQDLSERTTQMAAGAQFSLGKSFRGFGPTGPWLVTPDELADRDDLELGCSVDGECVQRSRTSRLIFSVPRLVAELSRVVDLCAGDLIFTGTPAGTGMGRVPPRFLRPGQVVESWIEGIGTIRNRMVAPAD